MNGTLLIDLGLEFGLGQRDLLRIIISAPRRYKVYQIPKRRGGTRTIAQPSRELKAFQRFVLRSILSNLPVHSAATGYVTGKNIFENASFHRGRRVIMKMDFEKFFPSILVQDWTRYVRSRSLPISNSELGLYNRILFWGEGTRQPKSLSIGAPTSPTISNVIMHKIDTDLADAAVSIGVGYTRYADDITVSGRRIEDVKKFEALARRIVAGTASPSLSFNEAKSGVYTMGQRRMVTGLVLTPEHKVSIGRQRKRTISVMLHKLKSGQSNLKDKAILKGLLGFCIANEPSFVTRMRDKYGNEVIDHALRYKIPRRRSIAP